MLNPPFWYAAAIRAAWRLMKTALARAVVDEGYETLRGW
jgi:hypothetical protein